MSYDLYFRPAHTVDPAVLRAWFEGRTNTTAGRNDADYDNSATGVHFQWWHGPPDDSQGLEPDDPLRGAQATLSVNFNRPSAFVHEAAIEAQALADEFGMRMIDPQVGHEAAMPYDSGAFVEGYLASASSVTARLLEHTGADTPATLPRQILTDAWDWNFHRDRRMDEYETDLFLPTIMFFQDGERTVTAVMWGDGLAQALPPVDKVLLIRDETAPRSGFFRRKSVKIAEWLDMSQVLAEFGDLYRESDRFGSHHACALDDGDALRARFAERSVAAAQPFDAWVNGADIPRLHFSTILDREFFAD